MEPMPLPPPDRTLYETVVESMIDGVFKGSYDYDSARRTALEHLNAMSNVEFLEQISWAMQK